jgi:hypothetical protein
MRKPLSLHAYCALFTLLYYCPAFAGEHTVSLALKSISMQNALPSFNTRILPSTGTTLSHELAAHAITLSFNADSRHVLLRGKDEISLYSIRDLIQRHIDN